MKIVLWGTYDTGKPRVRLLREGLRRNGFELIECHANVWEGIEDKSQISGGHQKLGLLLRWLGCYPLLIWRYCRLPAHDLVLINYPGLLDVLLIRCFAWCRRVPVAWDVFISAYDTVVEDRKMISHRHPLARLLWGVEWLALRAADIIFMDTQTHAKRIETLFHLREDTCGAVWVGAETEKFSPPRNTESNSASHAALQILFYGQFIPLHGIGYIIEAARLLRDAEVDWLLIGKGQEAARIREMLADDPLPRVRWIEWVAYSDLIHNIADADICLGIFGTSEKAASVIPNKVFQIVMAQKPLITRDSAAIRELLDECPPCTYLIPAGDAQALADAIERHITIKRDDREIVCHDGLVDKIDAAAIGTQFRALIDNKGKY
ncbi:glycosyltransferase [Glaciimonas soli]|uniref:Glycosyltransferase n=1 Tax=Glaciimonas soli TaxID=2590999 RepID=A0A843YUY1_9BURK|nr:glycosyltransferase [Glaciimonas soli]MQR01308.1 glycosyltransferase [Glaciimonas soli]